MPDRTPSADGSIACWSRSFSVGHTADLPLGVRVFAAGCQLAELIVGLRGGADREAAAWGLSLAIGNAGSHPGKPVAIHSAWACSQSSLASSDLLRTNWRAQGLSYLTATREPANREFLNSGKASVGRWLRQTLKKNPGLARQNLNQA